MSGTGRGAERRAGRLPGDGKRDAPQVRGQAAPPDVLVYSFKIKKILKFLHVPDLRASVPGFLSGASVTRRRRPLVSGGARPRLNVTKARFYYQLPVFSTRGFSIFLPRFFAGRSGGQPGSPPEQWDHQERRGTNGFSRSFLLLLVLRWGGTCPPPPPSLFLLLVSFDPRTCRECLESTSETVY